MEKKRPESLRGFRSLFLRASAATWQRQLAVGGVFDFRAMLLIFPEIIRPRLTVSPVGSVGSHQRATGTRSPTPAAFEKAGETFTSREKCPRGGKQTVAAKASPYRDHPLTPHRRPAP